MGAPNKLNAADKDRWIGSATGLLRQQQSARLTKLRTRWQPDWTLYESLKAKYTASATSSAEYEAGVRRAVREAGV